MRLPTPAALRDERGFTLIELIIVVMVLAILLSVAISTYTSYRERAHDTAARERVYNIVPSIQAYYVDHSGYSGMAIADLKASYDNAIDPAAYSLGSVTQSAYCVQSTSGGRRWSKSGPDGPLQQQSCP